MRDKTASRTGARMTWAEVRRRLEAFHDETAAVRVRVPGGEAMGVIGLKKVGRWQVFQTGAPALSTYVLTRWLLQNEDRWGRTEAHARLPSSSTYPIVGLTSTPTPERSEGSFVDIEIEVETLPVKARTGPVR
jgi:hypothetical protein